MVYRVRIPVAVLQNPRVFGGFVVLGVVRHSRAAVRGCQERIESLASLLFAARHEMSVAVPDLANIACPGQVEICFQSSPAARR
jgi:hypothetical protein